MLMGRLVIWFVLWSYSSWRIHLPEQIPGCLVLPISLPKQYLVCRGLILTLKSFLVSLYIINFVNYSVCGLNLCVSFIKYASVVWSKQRISRVWMNCERGTYGRCDFILFMLGSVMYAYLIDLRGFSLFFLQWPMISVCVCTSYILLVV
jgi:hypothetical protein